MMKTLALSTSILALASSAALAGGLDRSGQSISAIFSPQAQRQYPLEP